jgi:hypothetical protein
MLPGATCSSREESSQVVAQVEALVVPCPQIPSLQIPSLQIPSPRIPNPLMRCLL